MFRHVGIVVNDIENQLFFYKDLIGLKILYHEIEEGLFLEKILSKKGVRIDIYKLGLNGQTIVELLYYLNVDEVIVNKQIDDKGITHFAITVSDIETLIDNLKKHNVKFLSKPEINPKGTHKVCFCRDFENNLIELVQEL